MTINTIVNIVCSEVANTENLTDGSITEDVSVWDLDNTKTNTQYYLHAESIEIIEVISKKIYQLNWVLKGDDIPNDEIQNIYNGIIEEMNMLESSFNSAYHLVNSDLIKPQFAFIIENVTINGIPQELEPFRKFNNENKKLIEKFN